jgi:hypothetical protein
LSDRERHRSANAHGRASNKDTLAFKLHRVILLGCPFIS